MDVSETLNLDDVRPGRAAARRRARRSTPIVMASAAALVAAGLLYLRFGPLRVHAATAVRGTAVEAVYANGTVEAKNRVEIRARVAGPVVSLLAREGDSVQKDQLVAQIDAPALDYDMQRGQADLGTAAERATRAPLLASLEAQRRGLDAQLAEAKDELQRQRALTRENAATQQQLERAETLVASLEAQIAANRAQQMDTRIILHGDAARQRASLGSLESRLKDAEVHAPMTGTILVRHIEEGEIVAVNQSLLRVGDVSHLWIESRVDEADVGRVRVGMAAGIDLYAFENHVVWGHVVRILPDGDREKKSFEVDIELDKPLDGLLSGMTAEINIVAQRHEGALLVPADAVRDGHVWVMDKDGRAQRRQVKTGIHDLINVEILDGVAAGERVLLPAEGVRLSPGRAIQPIDSAAPAAQNPAQTP
jgi:multidrug efflux pump subunit AcrA (membrane-fusion protein)